MFLLQTQINSGGGGQGAGGVLEAGEERAGSGSSKRAGSRREMCNARFFNSTMRYNTLKNRNPKYIRLAFNVFSVTSETSEQTSKRKFSLGLKNRLTSGEIVIHLQWLLQRS